MNLNINSKNIKYIIYENDKGLLFSLKVENGEIVEIEPCNEVSYKEKDEDVDKVVSVRELIDSSKRFWSAVNDIVEEPKEDCTDSSKNESICEDKDAYKVDGEDVDAVINVKKKKPNSIDKIEQITDLKNLKKEIKDGEKENSEVNINPSTKFLMFLDKIGFYNEFEKKDEKERDKFLYNTLERYLHKFDNMEDEKIDLKFNFI